MNISPEHYAVFKGGSRTYFNSSIFFPPEIRRDVFLLYGFVRTADDFVDRTPQDADGFLRFREAYETAREGTPAGDPIIDSFVELSARCGFEPSWADAFLRSMEMDLRKRVYPVLDETLEYIYGSAEVIGFFMASIMRLPRAAFRSAARLGRAMQYINFIRDIDEDNRLGRRYLPVDGWKLASLDEEEAKRRPDEFRDFLRSQIGLYRRWQCEAEDGFRFLPRRYRVPVKTASDMYGWTAARIDADPFLVYRKKVKPGRARILRQVLFNALSCAGGMRTGAGLRGNGEAVPVADDPAEGEAELEGDGK